MKKILFAASEAVPFIKTGGLADVAGALPRYINRDEYDMRLILPLYACMSGEKRKDLRYVTHFYMDLGWRKQYVGVMETECGGITCYLIDNEYYFAGPAPYSEIHMDIEKFAFFSKAVLSVLPVLDFKPDIIHCNDWQTGLVSVYLKEEFCSQPFYKDIRTVMTIHNLKFQGIRDAGSVMDITGLPASCFTEEGLMAYGCANLLKGGLVYADAITTVSSQYANEIQTPEYGEGLDGLLRARSGVLSGIVNGLDVDAFDPALDPHIAKNYDVHSFRKNKISNKRSLQKELGLERDDKAFLLGLISRLTDQKGIDLLMPVMEELLAAGVQFAILGTGEERYESFFRYIGDRCPGRAAVRLCYSEELSHRIYAGADAFLVPSRFEPCGLTQLMALRYGTVPVVRETGGLKDTVTDYAKENSTGFTFVRYEAGDLLDAVRRAKSLYQDDRRNYNKLIERGMSGDYSWKKAAGKYEELYGKLIKEAASR